jgi:dTMP kinase
LRGEGYDVLRVEEPYEKNPFGQLLRKLLKTGGHPESHAALFLANRLALQHEVILPALAEGRPVISCRSFLSTLVYQQEQWPLDWLYALHTKLPVQPTHLVVLDVDPKTSAERIDLRTNVEVYEQRDILERVRQRYLNLLDDARLGAFLHPDCKPVILDGQSEIDRVTEMVRRVLDGSLGRE